VPKNSSNSRWTWKKTKRRKFLRREQVNSCDYQPPLPLWTFDACRYLSVAVALSHLRRRHDISREQQQQSKHSVGSDSGQDHNTRGMREILNHERLNERFMMRKNDGQIGCHVCRHHSNKDCCHQSLAPYSNAWSYPTNFPHDGWSSQTKLGEGRKIYCSEERRKAIEVEKRRSSTSSVRLKVGFIW